MRYRTHFHSGVLLALSSLFLFGCHAPPKASRHLPGRAYPFMAPKDDLPPACAIEPMFYGYHGTCWRPWPAGWVECPEIILEERILEEIQPGTDEPMTPPMPMPEDDAADGLTPDMPPGLDDPPMPDPGTPEDPANAAPVPDADTGPGISPPNIDPANDADPAANDPSIPPAVDEPDRSADGENSEDDASGTTPLPDAPPIVPDDTGFRPGGSFNPARPPLPNDVFPTDQPTSSTPQARPITTPVIPPAQPRSTRRTSESAETSRDVAPIVPDTRERFPSIPRAEPMPETRRPTGTLPRATAPREESRSEETNDRTAGDSRRQRPLGRWNVLAPNRAPAQPNADPAPVRRDAPLLVREPASRSAEPVPMPTQAPAEIVRRNRPATTGGEPRENQTPAEDEGPAVAQTPTRSAEPVPTQPPAEVVRRTRPTPEPRQVRTGPAPAGTGEPEIVREPASRSAGSVPTQPPAEVVPARPATRPSLVDALIPGPPVASVVDRDPARAPGEFLPGGSGLEAVPAASAALPPIVPLSRREEAREPATPPLPVVFERRSPDPQAPPLPEALLPRTERRDASASQASAPIVQAPAPILPRERSPAEQPPAPLTLKTEPLPIEGASEAPAILDAAAQEASRPLPAPRPAPLWDDAAEAREPSEERALFPEPQTPPRPDVLLGERADVAVEQAPVIRGAAWRAMKQHRPEQDPAPVAPLTK